MQDVLDKKVFIGLSGGVDSAVSAALLTREGARVTGVYIKGWYPPGMPCTWDQERRDSMRVAARLAIPFETVDANAEYKKSVIDYLLAEYKAGRTPNPDVMCNRDIKFGVFYRYALAAGADYIATGHYRSGEKDQSYFLWAVPKDALAKTVFPVGYMEKSEVRTLAKRFNIPVAQKKDSQGVCFLGSVSVKEFLEQEFGDNPAILHTLGERVEGGYVVGKDLEAGTITTAETPVLQSGAGTIAFQGANWHLPPKEAVTAQTRYRGPYYPGRIQGEEFLFASPPSELSAPGQSIVFYDARGGLVGGGIIA